ncbi:hypothetical protein [Paludisphaera mucosa]|uniref:Uncharacterized protein n=1 Tax=Paludisphaera mucosa TaxID=3030827 RepID=A0ABT6F4Z0_9BACT|nr:hypothetical protein [Paludisphaera mucosa]MDG3002503.1 hypothetical protein [Paludisphaera mucosa]
MDRFVALERLPDGFAVPAEYADRLSFDPAARRLRFRGYMSKTDFDRLCGLTSDWAFRRKLEELFRLCDYNGGPASAGRGGLFASLRKRFAPG